MGKIVWDESFSINNDRIDRQHKRWVEIYNDLYDRILNDPPELSDTISMNSLTSMQNNFLHHFKSEEKYMLEINYPELPEHIIIHNKFNKKIADINDRIIRGTDHINEELLIMIKEWLISHILVEDKKICQFVEERTNKRI